LEILGAGEDNWNAFAVTCSLDIADIQQVDMEQLAVMLLAVEADEV